MVDVSKPRPPIVHTDGPEHRRQIVNTLNNVMDGLGDLSGLDEVGTDQIADAAVTTAKIADGAVTSAKLSFTPTKGNLLVGNGTAWVELGVGTDEQVLTADAVEATGVKWADASGGLERGTAQAATGTSVDFTSIPAGVSRVTLMFRNLSMDASANAVLFRLGTSAGLVTTGYESVVAILDTGGIIYLTDSTGFSLGNASASGVQFGVVDFTRIDGDQWLMRLTSHYDITPTLRTGGGTITLPGALDRLSVLTSAGANFDAGTINIFWE